MTGLVGSKVFALYVIVCWISAATLLGLALGCVLSILGLGSRWLSKREVLAVNAVFVLSSMAHNYLESWWPAYPMRDSSDLLVASMVAGASLTIFRGASRMVRSIRGRNGTNR